MSGEIQENVIGDEVVIRIPSQEATSELSNHLMKVIEDRKFKVTIELSRVENLDLWTCARLIMVHNLCRKMKGLLRLLNPSANLKKQLMDINVRLNIEETSHS